ncbi:hypothetical protein RHODO2019_17545 [Rhodococcus antarcticus]|uniref:Alpha/beta hydrolase family protein n=1 Tax=Rhodococcus antarcticus TaxID=2987751 RepID=A0ABY6NZQ9_9NOCA|nr:hypothetical protein [Rhodococcus antarcticus]UZJ24877.1 hypothetical protein RHODO2019_17545 [Rhodococcus antarcticus]
MRTLVYLHGIGKANSDWLSSLNRSLVQQGIPAIEQPAVAAPTYADILGDNGHEADVPAMTYRVDDDDGARRDFERRQAALYRRLSAQPGVRGFGFRHLADGMVGAGADVALGVDLGVLRQVNNYVCSEGVRGAVLRRILSHIPTRGEIVLVAHSLGSVIAIDLLDHLPPSIHVSRFITIGSPANVDSLHKSSERLLKKFPYARVDDWTNFFGPRDIVPAGRGLARHFPGAQDFEVDIGVAHGAAKYLEQPVIAELVGEMFTERQTLAAGTPSTELALPVSSDDENVLLGLALGHAIAAHTGNAAAAERYRSALGLVQDNLLALATEVAASARRGVPSEVLALASGLPPQVPQNVGQKDAVLRLTTLAETNIITPYEIDTGKAMDAALLDIAGQLGFGANLGKMVGEALAEVREHTGRKGVPWGRVLSGAAGLALIAAGPVGLAVAMPAGVFGGAAIAGGLAAFGPGGMLGGVAMFGGLAGAGAAAAAAAAVSGHGAVSAAQRAETLLVRVAAQRALQLLQLPRDPDVWFAVTNLETALSSELARLRPFSDSKAAGLAERERALALVTSLLGFLTLHKLGPEALEQPEQGAIPEGRPARAAVVSLVRRQIGRR